MLSTMLTTSRLVVLAYLTCTCNAFDGQYMGQTRRSSPEDLQNVQADNAALGCEIESREEHTQVAVSSPLPVLARLLHTLRVVCTSDTCLQVDPMAAKRRDIWKDLLHHAKKMQAIHLRKLLQDETRNNAMFIKSGGIVLDFSRQKADVKTLQKLFALAEDTGVEDKRKKMFAGEHINTVEERASLHVALRAPRDAVIMSDGKNVVPEVWSVLDAVKTFVEEVRSGARKGYTGKNLTDVICIGIGGSYLGVEFVFEALKTEAEAATAAVGRRLRFLANVDPIDVKRALDGFSAETTLVIVISKTFTTAETMLNAKTVRQWLISEMGSSDCVKKHMVACSTALEKTRDFGIDDANVFSFWEWVGGRFSVCSVVGVLPLSLQYGFDVIKRFLEGAHTMDTHFRTAPLTANLPIILALLAVWNLSILGYESYAILPYSQALVRFVAHIQQLDMESNGKGVQIDGAKLEMKTGGIYFGEPGTNGQHSFYQLMHQGRTVPAEFIGFKVSQFPVQVTGEPVANHDELMANFFAQPDALALGKTAEDLAASGVPKSLIPHKTFSGDRPSLSLLLPVCDAFWLGQLLALYEHRTAVQGWIWNTNPFDQFGVELGKALAKDVRNKLIAARTGEKRDFMPAGPTGRLLAEYLS